ncbi:hypothetical protein [Streptomyces osmaniensis]|uniref:Uncharacterized protein n=1 Tax=Streptomyces osmaniensis TaxID=593134 RepID=A0ABP6YZQ2_9ACTN|nr:hypothetical protein KJK32_45530 [Streptomyces sp. JCM17656]
MRWLMALGERTRPETPSYAEDPAPGKARALALVDDFADLFTVLKEWRQSYGEELTAWAAQVEADDIEDLPAQLIAQWEGAPDRLDTRRGGYVQVSDYRDVPVRPGISARTPTGLSLWTTAR